jgi:isoleucyl-tRNA synthetase
MQKPNITTITTKEQARDFAIEWQHNTSDQNLSLGELADWQSYFLALAKQFDLTAEFSENGII